jgi:hypothetical protein
MQMDGIHLVRPGHTWSSTYRMLRVVLLWLLMMLIKMLLFILLRRALWLDLVLLHRSGRGCGCPRTTSRTPPEALGLCLSQHRHLPSSLPSFRFIRYSTRKNVNCKIVTHHQVKLMGHVHYTLHVPDDIDRPLNVAPQSCWQDTGLPYWW